MDALMEADDLDEIALAVEEADMAVMADDGEAVPATPEDIVSLLVGLMSMPAGTRMRLAGLLTDTDASC
ncbi:hypothetical protein E2C06_33600 [Dankookia rubra]|uniref:Uncharacterized protein n=1 Tax=Dankookia rubra TaxID=1442381 RepID=A0A4R5Q7K2_9PROT|nr:hypothetical protein [Dankookia rubra]TDH58251.1 hypothetical protein E2C06_33600 [Dankookia rubra]